MTYRIVVSPEAQRQLEWWRLHGTPASRRKISQLMHELAEHPRTGTGHPEPLRGTQEGRWSRRIDKNNRLVYTIDDLVVIVKLLSALGHYEDR